MLLRILVVGLVGSALSGCALLGVRKQVNTLEAYGAATALVSPVSAGAKPTYALAWGANGDGKMEATALQTVRPDGVAAFGLRADREYKVGAFSDENGNRKFDVGEPHAVASGVKPASLADPAAKAPVVRLNLRRESSLPAGTSIEFPAADPSLGRAIPVGVGEIVSLDDSRFVSDAGSSGLWKPVQFLTGNETGIFQLEPYDPNRIPVVLVYGIGGSPQDWKWFSEHVDRERYQIWFYHYPSGMRLARSARTLARGLALLSQRHGFRECHLVAHSMGGLVARQAIHDLAGISDGPAIREFVTISTPWGGHDAAAMGVRHMKKPVPSWLDVAPESAYLHQLYATPLPRGTRHTLLYGAIPGGPVYLRGENDGVVTVKSETEPRIVCSAAVRERIPFGHVPILSAPTVVRRVEEALRGK